jgi:hypothetical protein
MRLEILGLVGGDPCEPMCSAALPAGYSACAPYLGCASQECAAIGS